MQELRRNQYYVPGILSTPSLQAQEGIAMKKGIMRRRGKREVIGRWRISGTR